MAWYSIRGRSPCCHRVVLLRCFKLISIIGSFIILHYTHLFGKDLYLVYALYCITATSPERRSSPSFSSQQQRLSFSVQNISTSTSTSTSTTMTNSGGLSMIVIAAIAAGGVFGLIGLLVLVAVLMDLPKRMKRKQNKGITKGSMRESMDNTDVEKGDVVVSKAELSSTNASTMNHSNMLSAQPASRQH